eukprot:m.236012 g.236012  ORF g.236012 m.236012 type:complete len:199 (+) comp13918_c1_seq4:2553-3149(+)
MSKMQNHLFELKMAAKQLERAAKKCEKQAKSEKTKIKKALEKGLKDNARIYAENAIRQKNQQTQFLRMSARIDAVAQRVQTAIAMNQVTKSMVGVTKSMDKVMKSMNLEAISRLMDKFERQFEDLDVKAQVMESGMLSTTASTMPEGEVDMLMNQVADEHGLEMGDRLETTPNMVASQQDVQEEKDLSDRLAQLRGSA